MVSIIIPAYNNDQTIARTINSCLAQSYSDFEVIVVDNGSTDQTSAIVSDYVAKDSRIKLLHSPKGRSRARNAGLRVAQGELLQFLDADDELLPEKLERSVAAFDKDSELAGFVMATRYTDPQGQAGKVVVPVWRNEQQLLDSNSFPISAVTFRNMTVKLFEENLEYNEDWLFWASNLYGKKLKFDTIPGDVIHVDGSTTMMKHFDEMRMSEVVVRAKIKSRFPSRTRRLFRRDLRLASTYLIMRTRHPNAVMSVKPLCFEVFLMRLVFLVPKLKRHFEQLEIQTKARSMYV
jgi:glycosyltransferase involved in cell wall biosynthesis